MLNDEIPSIAAVLYLLNIVVPSFPFTTSTEDGIPKPLLILLTFIVPALLISNGIASLDIITILPLLNVISFAEDNFIPTALFLKIRTLPVAFIFPESFVYSA